MTIVNIPDFKNNSFILPLIEKSIAKKNVQCKTCQKTKNLILTLTNKQTIN